jgi:hypothetical protein
MVESEIDEYKLDTNQGKKDQTLRISIVTDRICMLISNPKDLRERYINLITLEQLRDVCPIFEKTQTISEAVAILKNAIETNHILYSEDEESGNVEIKFNISQGQTSFPPFVIPLPFDSDEEDKQNVEVAQMEDENQTENETPHENENENDIEVLPTKYDYQGNKEAEAKYGKSDKSTVDYAEPIIQSKVKEANVILEYIEPILQVHYPDGTTKSTPLPPRIQTADGKKPNIDPEQLKSIHEQMTRSFNQAIEEFEKERNRANSVAQKNTKNNLDSSRQTVNVNNFGNNINILKTENNYGNNSTIKNGVGNALNQGNNNFNNTVNIASIRQVRTAFNQNDDNSNNIQKGVNNKNLPNGNTSPRQNFANYRTQIIGKENSDFSTNSLPNKPLDAHDFNFGGIQNGTMSYNLGVPNRMNLTSNYMHYTQNPQPIIQEVPKMSNPSPNMTMNINQNFYQRGLNKSSSTPNMAALDKNNHDYFQKYQQQLQQNNLQKSQNQSYFQNQINNVPLRNPANQQNMIRNLPNLQTNNSQILFNQARNPNPNQTMQYQNKTQILNKFNMNNQIHFQTQNNNMLYRHNSGQSPLISQNYLSQQQQRLLQHQYNQQRFQMEQQRRMQEKKILQEQQRLQEQKRLQEKQLVQKKIQEQQQRLMQIAQQRKQIFNMLAQFPQRQGKNNAGSRNMDQGFAEVNSLPKRNLNTINGVNSSFNLQHSQPINPNLSLNQTQQIQRNMQNGQIPSYTLKQSQSQQIIKQKPSIKAPEITQQQIALAQMASLQNLQNPNMSHSQAIPLQNRFLDSEGNEETQSQYEREEDKTYNEIKGKEKTASTPQAKAPENLQRQGSAQEQDDDIDSEAENLYRTETGLIIFRNGLLHGIIHKYAEVDDIVSKIQLKLKAGVKFMLVYSASRDGDKAKTFHSKCDAQKMSLVLVETTKGVRFGGFTMKDWGGKCVKKIDNEAFVFNLDTRKCFDVIKNEFAIGGYPKFGPVFFGCQIRIYDDFFKKGGTTCHRTLNYNTKKDYELNNGEQNYIVKEIEVYGIETIDV